MSYLLNSEYAPPTMLTGMIRAALHDLQVNQYTLSRWLPNVNIDDTTYRFTKGGQGLAEASVFRSYDAESRIGRRETVSQVLGELPPISEKMVLSEWDQLRLRHLNDGALLPFIARDAERLARNIGARFEIARGDAIFNGSVTIAENGVQQVVSFGRSGSHSVTAAILWTAYSTAVPLDDLESWIQTYTDTNGFPPSAILMPRAQFANFRRCDQVRNQVFPLASSAPTVSAEQARTVLESLDFPPVIIYDAQVKIGDSATVTRITPANKIALMPAPGSGAPGPTDLGAILMGTTVEALDADYGLAPGDRPGIVAANYKSTDPRRLWTHAVAIGLPVAMNPDLTFVAAVAA